jgi:cyclohexa-1,5-dienecarbonyl-CoA hydratase
MTDPGAPETSVRVSREGPLCVITLDRPPLNVVGIGMLRELTGLLAEVAADESIAAVMITGEGRAFCAGVDVADHTEDRVEEMIEVLHEALTALSGLPMPVVAAVNGAALGGGLELALACDVVMARAGAKLGQPEIRLGVFPPYAAAVLPRLVGRANALDLCLTGRTFTAEEGRELGLVQHVYAADDFASASREYASEIASLSPAVLRLTKRAVVDGLDGPVSAALGAAERIYLNDLMRLEDAHEGLAAFLEKRDPAWKGA